MTSKFYLSELNDAPYLYVFLIVKYDINIIFNLMDKFLDVKLHPAIRNQYRFNIANKISIYKDVLADDIIKIY